MRERDAGGAVTTLHFTFTPDTMVYVDEQQDTRKQRMTECPREPSAPTAPTDELLGPAAKHRAKVVPLNGMTLEHPPGPYP
jgi:hypothetical protein